MRVRVLGPVVAEHRGRTVNLGGRKQRAVFALLALGVNRPVALDRLVHEIWRDEPPAQATLSLQSYISRLRRSIADAHAGAPADDVPRIVTRAPGWVLKMDPDAIDAVRFSEFVETSAALFARDEVQAAAAALREALDLWTGEALADLADLPFAQAETTRLHELRLAALETQLEVDLALGREPHVVTTARSIIGEDPYRERAWCAWMLALYRQGRQAEALSVANDLRETLSDGLGLDPSPAARALQQQILRQDPTLDRAFGFTAEVSKDSRVAGDAEPIGTPGEVAVHEWHLVGRDVALDVIEDVRAAARSGRGRFLLVKGPAGMGKSSVLAELVARLESDGGLVVRGGGVGAGTTPALWPWVSMLRQLVAADPELAESAASGATAAALALLDPSVRTGSDRDGTASGPDPGLARTRLYRAVVDLLAAAHLRRPMTLVVDDAQWLDGDTVGLLTLVASELVPRGVLVVVAVRDDEGSGVVSDLESMATRLGGAATMLPLTGLAVPDVEVLLRRISAEAGTDLSGLARAVVARTGGNPFFASELLRLLSSERQLDVTAVETVLPHQVRDVLRRRLDRLPQSTVALLTVVALLNRPADIRLLAEVDGTSLDDVLDDTESAVASSLLVEDVGHRRFALSHDLVRQTLEESLSGLRRARVHARIAEVLRARERHAESVPPEMVVEIARHLVLAEAVVGPGEAIPYLITVADDARERSAFDLAERALHTALELCARVDTQIGTDAMRVQIRSRLVLMSSSATIHEVPALEDPVHDQRAAGTTVDVRSDPVAWWSAQILEVAAGRSARARAAARPRLDEALTPDIEAVVESILGLCLMVAGDVLSAEEHLTLADDLGEASWAKTRLNGETSGTWISTMRVFVPGIRAMGAVLQDQLSLADQHLAAAYERAGTSATELVFVEYIGAWKAALIGDPQEAERHASACLNHGRSLGESYYVPMSQLVLCWARAELGDSGAAEAARESYESIEGLGMRFQASVHLTLCAEALARHGRLDIARECVREARAEAELTGERTLGKRLTKVLDGILFG